MTIRPITEETVRDALQPIIDPDIGLSLVEMGLIYGAEISDDGKKVKVIMTLTSPTCPYGPLLVSQVKEVTEMIEGVEEAKVEIVWDPPWDPATMGSEDVQEMLGY